VNRNRLFAGLGDLRSVSADVAQMEHDNTSTFNKPNKAELGVRVKSKSG